VKNAILYIRLERLAETAGEQESAADSSRLIVGIGHVMIDLELA
jgi:hypothetical protein